MATTKKVEEILVKPVEREIFTVRIVGDSPLIVHNWAKKNIDILIGPVKNATKSDPLPKMRKEPRDPFYDFIESCYWIEGKPTEYTEEAFDKAVENGAKFGFPVTGIKKAAVNGAARGGSALKQAVGKGTFFLRGIGRDGMFAEIQGEPPMMRQDVVRLANKTTVAADVRWRPQFNNWHMDLTIEYNKNGLITAEQIVNMINLGGFVCGLGEWRPEKGGTYGMYHVKV